MADDSFGRRLRTRPTSTGKRITPQASDLLWFSKLREHGPLPSSYLLTYTAGLRKSTKRAVERLTDLFNEEETKHGGRYLERPPQQFRTIDSRYNQLVYDLLPAAEAALLDAGLDASASPKPTGPWLHRFMVSCVTASIELATLERPEVTYIPQHLILERAKTGLSHSVTFAEPGSRSSITKDLIPDAVFGLQYHTPDGDRFRFFAVECDRATEPVTTQNWGRKSWLRNLLQYREYVVRKQYQKHLSLTAPLLVLNITTEERRVERMLAVTSELAGEVGNSYQLFQVVPDFGPVFKPSAPLSELLTSPWVRAGLSPFFIDRP
ncbi:MAG: replication-relaxation family protein [Candidatus Sedimenticola sp. 20ELBAFRAG]